MEELLFKYNQLNPKAREILLAFLGFLFSDRKNRTIQEPKHPIPPEKTDEVKFYEKITNISVWSDEEIETIESVRKSWKNYTPPSW